MRQSNLFTKTTKEPPSGESSRNAQLLRQAGYIQKEMSGVYSFLPLGLKVLNNITDIIREEMSNIGGQELKLTALQDNQKWKQTNRWDDKTVDVWFKTNLHEGNNFHEGRELGLGNTHEEAITQIAKKHIDSYKDLPKYVYQIQTKFRNELRAKSGLLRGREFLMKDLYAFSTDKKQHQEFHEKAQEAYEQVYKRVGIGDRTFLTLSPGGSFSKFSHEFQTLTEAGEDTIYICDDCEVALNEEVMDTKETCFICENKDLRPETAAEVGDIYTLKTKFSKPLGLTYTDKNSQQQPVFMGSYGIGCDRLMGTVVEVHNDENGIVWPKPLSPYDIHLVNITHEKEQVNKSEQIYNNLRQTDLDILYDDRRDAQAGEKFADSDLLGIPTRVIISSSNLDENKAEIENRSNQETSYIELDNLTSFLNKKYVQ